MPTYALCFCHDGQHAEPDRESLRPDRAAVESGVMYVRDTDAALRECHLVEAVTTITAVEFADANAAAWREDVLAMWAAQKRKGSAA